MTTFERFRRDVRSRSNSGLKSSVKKANSRNDQKIHDNLIFSNFQIVFVFDQKQPQSIFKLKILNQTGYRIHFKIRCNNSKCYTVTPYEEVISDRGSMEVKFQFFPNLFQPNSKTNSNMYMNDKFQILWGKISQKPQQPTTLTESKLFPVIIKQKQTNLSQDIFKDFSGQKRIQSIKKTSAIQPSTNNKYEQNRQAQLEMMKEQKIFAAILQANMPYKSLLTKYNIILVSVIAFIFGFIFS